MNIFLHWPAHFANSNAYVVINGWPFSCSQPWSAFHSIIISTYPPVINMVIKHGLLDNPPIHGWFSHQNLDLVRVFSIATFPEGKIHKSVNNKTSLDTVLKGSPGVERWTAAATAKSSGGTRPWALWFVFQNGYRVNMIKWGCALKLLFHQTWLARQSPMYRWFSYSTVHLQGISLPSLITEGYLGGHSEFQWFWPESPGEMMDSSSGFRRGFIHGKPGKQSQTWHDPPNSNKLWWFLVFFFIPRLISPFLPFRITLFVFAKRSSKERAKMWPLPVRPWSYWRTQADLAVMAGCNPFQYWFSGNDGVNDGVNDG